MKRFTTTVAALALFATPVLADNTATTQLEQLGSEVGQDGPLSPDAATYGVATLIGSDVFTTNQGAGNLSVEGLDRNAFVKIGDVEDVWMTNAGTIQGVVVDPVDESDESFMYFPVSDITIVDDVDGPRYMIGMTADEMAEIERIENPGQFGQ
ncbi:hypothetical protein G5B38_03710 [Pseudohalocynthiibacter aestuariivivens]|uniref:PRC-barrel domain-containing protein n=1 Tax=Roseovarius pelagicus TaxID=2980108 RepID=A0ABY6DB47_9RHOB|nr:MULTISPECIES: hypothetical protein [Rhodobacterales]QIE44702.1 hypothetical protein G5B38_03710 [Pseudohalocynthiibacter aestuariivivens]UXX83387.1 hypothetical protein N7U68_01490 [Roseovarius pelagicus]